MTDFPEKVIVEMGADNPGDIKYLAKLFKPKVGVVLEVLPVHVEQFKDLSAVAKEKAELVSAVPVSGRVYLNYDNPDVRKMADRSKAPIFYFGTSGDCLGYCAKDIKTDISGMNFSLLSEGKKYSFTASLYGKHMIYPLLAAIAVANGEGISISDLAMKTKKLKPYKGRMNIIAGINGSIIIDDTYNANPASTMEALDFLYNQKGRHIAILGNMNELGEYEKVGHRMVGEKAASCVDYLFTVGEVAKSVLAPAAIAAGMNSGHIKSFDTAREAGQYVSKILKEDDVVLAKGSQNKVRMEKAVEFLMAKPSEKKNLLVRQSDFWKEN